MSAEFEPINLEGFHGNALTCALCGIIGKPSSTWEVAFIPAEKIRGANGVAIAVCGVRCKDIIASHPELNHYVRAVIDDCQENYNREEGDHGK